MREEGGRGERKREKKRDPKYETDLAFSNPVARTHKNGILRLFVDDGSTIGIFLGVWIKIAVEELRRFPSPAGARDRMPFTGYSGASFAPRRRFQI